MDKLIKILNDQQLDHNERSKTKLNLVFFREAIQHLMSILRIINQPRGNALLVGIGGLGKGSLSKLATFIAGYPLTTIESSGKFNSNQYLDWLSKDIILMCAGADKGPKGKQICLMVSDSQIQDLLVLESLNSLLNSGEVPNIFMKDDRETIIKDITELYQEQLKVTLDQNEAWKVFCGRVRSNLKMILCMSPVGPTFRNWCR